MRGAGLDDASARSWDPRSARRALRARGCAPARMPGVQTLRALVTWPRRGATAAADVAADRRRRGHGGRDGRRRGGRACNRGVRPEAERGRWRGAVLAKLAGVGAVLGLAAGGALLAVGGQRSENDGKSGRQAAALHTPADVSGRRREPRRSDRAVRSRQTARAINGSRAHASETSARRARRPNSARSRRASTGARVRD